ncbi:mas-related G-protein coupled receptor member H-like [Dendropsophus ebraccatus]|uniref:mas-related G-protein coupled receptor member H-like n=1 Tax=Dendropsophus ebraccatus TaxID=150705 RepID=UPI0038322E6F
MMINESLDDFINNASWNGTEDNQSLTKQDTYALPLTIFSLALSVLGLLGNGIVIWFLCVKIKRNSFTIYILNLAVADFSFLLGLLVWMMYTFCYLNGLSIPAIEQSYLALIIGLLYNFGFNASIYLLMVIALERYLAALYPFWYQFQRPTNLSPYLCTVFWLLSLLVTGLENFICMGAAQYQDPGSENCTYVYFFTSALYLTVVPIMVLSSVTLVAVFWKKRWHHAKPYIVIVISVMVFMLSVIPARILGLLLYFKVLQTDDFLVEFFFVTSLCSAFNCSANPYIYMAVGRWGKQKIEEGSVKHVLEKVFKEATENQNMT